MKAVIVEAFGPFKNAQVRTVADPVPGRGEVCVALMALHDGKAQGKIILTLGD
jgi:NADPH:quinone reductase-like Zn-dependent oxidoreductase